MEGSFRWRAISATGKLWSGSKRNEVGHPQRLLPRQPGYSYKKIQSRKAKGRLESTPQKFYVTLEWDGYEGKSIFFFFFFPLSFLFFLDEPASHWLPGWREPGTQFRPKDWVAFEPMRVKTCVLPWADIICVLINIAHQALIICQALYLQARNVLSYLLLATFWVKYYYHSHSTEGQIKALICIITCSQSLSLESQVRIIWVDQGPESKPIFMTLGNEHLSILVGTNPIERYYLNRYFLCLLKRLKNKITTFVILSRAFRSLSEY